MKKLIAILVGINIIAAIIGFSLFYLTETYPFHPGETFFAVQDLAETWQLQLTERGERQINGAIELAERRLADLAQAEDHSQIDAAIVAFDEAISEAVQFAQESQVSPESESLVLQQLDLLFSKAKLVLYAIEKKDDCQLVSELHTKIDALSEKDLPIATEMITNSSSIGPMRIEAEVITFLGRDVDHDAYPLSGKHDQVDCLYCHPTGEYVNTPTECQLCHTEYSGQYKNETAYLISLEPNALRDPADTYPNHFEGSCEECHNTESWDPTSFDHRGVFECSSCHAEEVDDLASETYEIHANYPSQCILCHEDVEDWETIKYDHPGVEECQSCHADAEPSNHYPEKPCESCHTDTEDWNTFTFDHEGYSRCKSCHDGPDEHYIGTCSTCHRSTNSWLDYNFIHIAMKDCKTCHTADADHYGGQCSNCHNNTAWKPASFRHIGYSVYECKTCHLDDAPSNHYSTACGLCHNTISWSQIIRDHSGATACVTCHDGDEPANHYGDSCGKCHNTSSWSSYTFNHSGYTDCSSCHSAPSGHYTGQCSNCHNTTSWQDISFSHAGLDKCQDCHSAPSGHWPGQCVNCHISTSSWTKIKFDHNGFSDCKACHGDERPGSPHPSYGQCSKCHTTEGWYPPIITATPIPTNTPIPTDTPEPTNTSEPTATPITPEPTATSEIPQPTVVPPGGEEPTATPVTVEPTDTPIVPEPTNTPIPPDPTNTPIPPAPTNTPVPPDPTDEPEPSPTPVHHEGDDCSVCHP